MGLRIEVDRDRCMGSGNCSFHAPATFDLDEEGIAVVLDPEGDLPAKIHLAVEGCPTSALSVTEVPALQADGASASEPGGDGCGAQPHRMDRVVTAGASPPQPFRVLPRLDDTNRGFWTGGEHGELRIARCDDCATWVHPPAPVCPSCHGRSLRPAPTSGRAVLHTYTVNRQPWYPGLEPPYVVGIVDLADQPGLRLTAGIVGVEPDDVWIGMPLHVVFEQYDDVWLPFFEPAR